MQPSSGTNSTYPQSGEVLDGKYRVEQLLGEGGMGAVAKATHLLRRAPVALKFMSGSVLSMPGAVERFVNEGVAASQIDSDHVVKVFDVGRLPSGAPYLVMEYLDGQDLGQLLEREGPILPIPRAVHFVLQALRALQTAHIAGIIHRDMKPSNCFVIERDGERDFVKLVDFGISKVRAADDGQGPHLTRTNSALGTPLYMSSEQARSPRDVDHRTDLYSVGAILYELLSGRTPYTAESGEFTEILFKIFTTDPEPLAQLRPDLPAELAAAVHRALQRDPNARYASAYDMAEAFAPFADERSAQVLSRLRSGRRSTSPPMHSITPAQEDHRALPNEATARTHASVDPRPPSTQVGVTREAPAATSPGRGRAVRAGLVVGGVLVALAAAETVALRAHAPQAIGAEPSVSLAIPAPAPAPPSAPEATAALAPESTAATIASEAAPASAATADARQLPAGSSAAPVASGAPSARPLATSRPLQPVPHAATASAASAPPGPPPGTPLPTQLGDLKLH